MVMDRSNQKPSGFFLNDHLEQSLLRLEEG